MAGPITVSQRCDHGRATVPLHTNEGTTMKNILKSGTFRALMLLSALASSGLVLEAARRWGP